MIKTFDSLAFVYFSTIKLCTKSGIMVSCHGVMFDLNRRFECMLEMLSNWAIVSDKKSSSDVAELITYLDTAAQCDDYAILTSTLKWTYHLQPKVNDRFNFSR